MFTQMDDIRPLFFPTEVASELRRPHTQQLGPYARRENEDRLLSPFQRLRRMKEVMERSKKQYQKALSQNHRLQVSLSKLERKKHLARTDFFKVYGNLKYKKFLQESKTESQSRSKILSQQRADRTKKKRLEQELQRMLFKNEEQERIQIQQQKNRRDKDKFNETKDKKKGDLTSWSKQKHDTVRNQHTQFVIRKSNISTILQQRSKLNYMKKVNKELSLLKEYENVIDQIGTFNIDEIKRLTGDQEKLNEYETFFMTTKNTIS